MIDNVYNETPLTDGFDKFIEDSNKTETERCTYDNIDYIVPAGFSPATYSFRSAELILDGNNLMDKETNFKACLPDTRFAISFFLFVTQVENEGCCDDEAVQAWLYKKGKRKALAIRKEIPNEDGIYFDFSELGDSLSPGEYFLLLNNLEASESDCNFEAMGTNLRFSFSILPDGRHLAHPDIRNIRLHRDRTPLAGTSGRISLSFSLSRAMRKYDEFTACCYDESFSSWTGFSSHKALKCRRAEKSAPASIHRLSGCRANTLACSATTENLSIKYLSAWKMKVYP